MPLSYPSPPAQSESRSVLAIPAFRKLWNAMAFSSFGDWLGLLASTALAQQLAGGDYAEHWKPFLSSSFNENLNQIL